MSITNLLETGGGLKILADIAQKEEQKKFIGQQFEGYTVDEYLSSGASGVVFKAHRSDGQFQRVVAVKFLSQTIMPEESRQRFLMERQILAQLQHPNIAQLLDAGMTESGIPYFIMEYVDGLTLDAYLKAFQPTLKQKLTLFKKLVDAISHAHELQIVHRDIKPSNILVLPDGEPRLIDFGIAKAQELESDYHFSQHPLTLQFASPEQILKSNISLRSDVYQLGIVLFYLLCGELPFKDGNRKSIEQRVHEGNTAASPYLRFKQHNRKAAKQIRGDLDAIVLKCMAADPESRYVNAWELAGDIRRYEDGIPILARENTPEYRIIKFAVRNRAIVLLMMLSMILLSAASSWFTYSLNEANKLIRQEKSTSDRVVALMSEIFNAGSPFIKEKDRFDLHQVIQNAELKVDDIVNDEPEVAAQLYYVLANLHHELDQPETSLRLMSKVNQTDISAWLKAQNLLIKHHLERDELQYAEPLITRQEALFKEHSASPAMADFYLLKARYLASTDKFESAREEAQFVLTFAHTIPQSRLLYARVHQFLANSYVEAQDADKVLFHINRVKQAIIELKGSESLDLASLLGSEASALLVKAQFREAQQAFAAAIKIAEKFDSGNRLVLQRLYNNMASLLYQQSDNMGAISYIKKNREILMSAYDESHAKVIRASLNLGVTLTGVGALNESKALLESVVALAGKSKVYPYAMSALGFVARELGDYTGAKQYYLETLNYLEQTHGKNTQVYQKNALFMQQVECLDGTPGDFQPKITRASNIIKQASGTQNYSFGLALFTAGVCYMAIDDVVMARDYFLQYQQIVEAISGKSSDYYAVANLQLAKIANQQADYREVIRLLNLDPAVFVNAPYIVSRVEILYLKMVAHARLGATEKAEEHYQEIQQLLIKVDWSKPKLQQKIESFYREIT